MNKKALDKIGKSFEQDGDNISSILEYYFGVNGFTVEKTPSHPDHLWVILDRIESDIIIGESETSMKMSEEQSSFILYFIAKWKKDIEPYCVRFEPE